VEYMEKVLIIGGGAGGIILANSLDPKDYNVTVVDKDEYHYYQPWYLYVAFKGSKRKIGKPISSLLKPGIRYVKDEITEINLNERRAFGSLRITYDYDYVIIATGTSPDPEPIPGLREVFNEYGDYHTNVQNSLKLWNHIKNFKGGTIAIGQASPTCKCPPSLLEGAFQLEEYLNKKGLKSKSKIKFFTPFPRAYPAEPMNKVVEPMVEERGIEVMPFFDLDTVDNEKKILTSIEGDNINYDLPIIVPPCRGTKIKVLPEGLQNEDRFIISDKYTMKIKGFDNAFAVGDANNLPTSKTGVTAHLEAKVVANIIQGKYDKFTGRINCPFDTAYGKATFVIADYDNPVAPYPPTRMKHFMKMSMARIYWMTLKGYADPIFDFYFDFTNPVKLNEKYATS
jgi:sulfide:quinone oxidoreductase